MAENFGASNIDQKFKNPEEELNFLRAEVERHQKALAEKGEQMSQNEVIKTQLAEHAQRAPAATLDKDYALKPHEAESIVLDLAPETHDEKMGEMIQILQEKGVLNAISIIEALKDPHLEDDFHRFLVQ